MSESRQWVVNLLRHAGYLKAAEEAERVLPDPVTMEEAQEFAARHGVSHDELLNQMGGSP